MPEDGGGASEGLPDDDNEVLLPLNFRMVFIDGSPPPGVISHRKPSLTFYLVFKLYKDIPQRHVTYYQLASINSTLFPVN